MLRYLKKMDGVSKEEHHGNMIGGAVSVIGYIIVLAMTVNYLTTARITAYPITTGVAQFPNSEPAALTMPPINCVATNGCYIKSQTMQPNTCLFLAQGEAVPAEYRKLFYTSDPFEMFQVLSTDSGENFALSFDFETVTKYTNPLETSTLKAAIDFGQSVPMPYKIFRGLNTFNLIRTLGVDGSEVDTWSAQLTKDESSFTGSGGCCGATDIKNANGGSDSAAVNTMTQCGGNANTWWTTILVPPATYSEVTVVDPLDAGNVLGLVGGWVGVVMAALAVVYHLIHDTGMISADSKWMKAEDDEVAASENEKQAQDVQMSNVVLTEHNL